MRKIRAFTLLEILVAAGVVAVLAAVAIPFFRIGIARSESAACVANLRLIGVGLQSFLAENGGVFPVIAAARESIEDTETVTIDVFLLPYVEQEGVFACPADAKLAVKTGTSYYWNSALNGQPVASLNFLGLISDFSGIPVLVDKEGWHRHTENRVNHLFADGHASATFRLFAE